MQHWCRVALVLIVLLVVSCGDNDGSNPIQRSWGTPELLESSDGFSFNPQIIFDANGNAIAVWSQHDGTRDSIWANRFDGSRWGAATLIEADDAGDAYVPKIAVDDGGNAIAVWHQNDGNRFNICANRFDGSNWGSATLIETENGQASNPQIAVNSSGNAIAVWHQYDGFRYSLRANRYSGSSWGVVDLIDTGHTGNVFCNEIAVDTGGNAIAVWSQYDGTRDNVWTNRFNGSIWGVPTLLETVDEHAQCPRVAAAEGGSAIAVWVQGASTNDNVWVRHFDGTSWGAAEMIETDDGIKLDPQIAVDAVGNAIVVWRHHDGARFNIRANRFDGTRWGVTELIETDDAGDALDPQIAVDAGGNAIAVWAQRDGLLYNIWANRFDGTRWGVAELIETDDAGYALGPQIAVDANGNAIAVWAQDDGTNYNIWANRYE